MAGLSDFKAVEERAQQCLGAYPGVLVAYVFGSVAAERTHANSDVDIAVLVDDDVMKSDTLRYRLKLLADLSEALYRPDVDLILLNQAPPLLAHRILRDGRLILERSAAARVRFQVYAVNRYLDTQPMRNFYLDRLKKDIREDKVFG